MYKCNYPLRKWDYGFGVRLSGSRVVGPVDHGIRRPDTEMAGP